MSGFAAELPNECWAIGLHPPPLATGTGTEILYWLDAHSRYALSVTAWNRVTGPIVLATCRADVTRYGAPASTLTDIQMVFTTRYSCGLGGRNTLEHELRRLGVRQKDGRPNHPQTQGKSNDSSRPSRTGSPPSHPSPPPSPSCRPS